jgi:DNA-binding NarL/FixJ family response regulator
VPVPDRPADEPLRVLVAEDDLFVRSGIVRMLAAAGHEVVAEAGDADELVRRARGHRPDVVVTDVRMPPTNTDDGVRAAAAVRAELPGTGVLLLSQHVAGSYVEELLRVSVDGVGYLLKERVKDPDELAQAVARVGRGDVVLDKQLVRALAAPHEPPHVREGLTERDRAVLSEMAEGRTNRGVAEQLSISERAVEKHVTAIFSKLGLDPSPVDHRRVLAVLAHLRAERQPHG